MALVHQHFSPAWILGTGFEWDNPVISGGRCLLTKCSCDLGASCWLYPSILSGSCIQRCQDFAVRRQISVSNRQNKLRPSSCSNIMGTESPSPPLPRLRRWPWTPARDTRYLWNNRGLNLSMRLSFFYRTLLSLARNITMEIKLPVTILSNSISASLTGLSCLANSRHDTLRFPITSNWVNTVTRNMSTYGK